MNIKNFMFSVPLIGLLVYTMGAFFLLFLPQRSLMLSPGENTLYFPGIIPGLSIVLVVGLFVFMLLNSGKGKSKRRKIR